MTISDAAYVHSAFNASFHCSSQSIANLHSFYRPAQNAAHIDCVLIHHCCLYFCSFTMT